MADTEIKSRTYHNIGRYEYLGKALGYVIDDMSHIDGIISWDGNTTSPENAKIRWGRASTPPVALVQRIRDDLTEVVTVYGLQEDLERFDRLVRAKESELADKVAPPSV